MSATIENSFQHSIIGECRSTVAEHMLALVQGDMVISTFPEDQMDAAIDLARVLCRALSQPVDLFRVRYGEVEPVQVGASAQTAGPGWTHVAHLHFAFLKGVEVVMRETERQGDAVVRPPSP